MKMEKIKIMLIDDDPFTMAITGETIKRAVPLGETLTFFSAADALQHLATEDGHSAPDTSLPGMILSDLHMPGIDGFQFLDEFAKLSLSVHRRYSAFILSSSSDAEEWAKLSGKSCLAGFCRKPLTIHKLRTLMEITYREYQKKNPGYNSHDS